MAQKTFQKRLLLDALSVTSKVKQKLEPFIAQISKGNIEWTFLVFSQLYQYLSLPQAELSYKFNSLVATKVIMDTCEYPVILIVEVYLLPLIKKIACYQINLPQKSRGIDYFVNNGYEKSSNSKRLGYNFVRLACQIINFFSIIKPYELYKYQEVSEPSQFAVAFQYMRSQGWKEYGQLAFYDQNPLTMRSLFLQKLQNFQESLKKYQNFIRSSLENIIKKDLLPIGLDPRKIVQFYQIYASNFTLQLIKQFALSFQAVALTNVLKLISEMIRWGNIGAIYTIEAECVFDNFIEMIDKIETQQADPHNDRYRFQKIIGTQQQKISFYLQLLKSLEVWAACIPRNLKDNQKDSKSTLLFKKLAFERGVRFPIVTNIKKISNQCCQNMQKYKKLNQRWLKSKLDRSEVVIPKHRRSTNELRQLFNTPTGKTRKDNIFNDSTIFRQTSKDSTQQRHLKYTQINQSQSALENIVNSPSSQITGQKKCPFTQKFYRQKKRKRETINIEFHNNYSKTQASSFKKAHFETAQIEKRRCSVSNSLFDGFIGKILISGIGSFSKDSDDFSDQQTLYSQEVEQGKVQPIIKSIQNKLRMKHVLNNEISPITAFNQSKNQNLQTKVKSQFSTKSKVSIRVEEDRNTDQNMQFFSSLSSTSSQSCLQKQKKIHAINIFPPHLSSQSAKSEVSYNCNNFTGISSQGHSQSKFFKNHLSKMNIIQLQKLQEKVTSLEQENNKLKNELQKKQKQLESYKLNDSDNSAIIKDKKNKRFSWTSYLFGDQQPLLDETEKKLSQLKKMAVYRHQQLVTIGKFKNEIAQLDILGGKKLVKNKDLLIRTQNIEIGFVFQLEKEIGKVTFYITPEKDLNQLNYKLVLMDNIKCSETSQIIQTIPKKKQRKITFNFKVIPPYMLPKLMLSYSLEGTKYNNHAIVPISYNKFVSFQKTPKKVIQPLIRKKSQIQMINKRFLSNKQAFYQYFSCLPYKDENTEDQQFQCSANIRNKQFNILFSILNEDFIQLQYVISKKNQQIIDSAEFFVATLMAIIKK